MGGLKSWCPAQTADAPVSAAPSCIRACRPGPAASALLCLPAFGGEGGSGGGGGGDFKWRAVFRSLDIFLLWILRNNNYALGSREKGKQTLWTCVWPFHEVAISVCAVDNSEIVWGHLET